MVAGKLVSIKILKLIFNTNIATCDFISSNLLSQFLLPWN